MSVIRDISIFCNNYSNEKILTGASCADASESFRADALIRARNVETRATSGTTREFGLLINLTFIDVMASFGVRLA